MSKHHLRGDAATRRVWLDGKELLKAASQKVWNHSPDGFNWGYGGSGPAQLALAICLALTRDRSVAMSVHQRFKREVVTHLPCGEDFDDFWFDWPLFVAGPTTPAIEPDAQNPATQERSNQSASDPSHSHSCVGCDGDCYHCPKGFDW